MAQPLPLLYHGTSTSRAKSILRGGFRRSKQASYTGTAVNLTESPCMAWEYGPDRGGKILAVTLSPETRCQDATTANDYSRADEIFAQGNVDALRTFGGNVWLLWVPACAQVRLMSMEEVMVAAVAEWRQNGPEMGYGGDMDWLAELFWKGEDFVRSRLRICAPSDFDREAWKNREISKYKRLLALAHVAPGDGSTLVTA